MKNVNTDWIINTEPAHRNLQALIEDVETVDAKSNEAQKSMTQAFANGGRAVERFNTDARTGATRIAGIKAEADKLGAGLRSLYGQYGNLTAQQKKFLDGSDEYKALGTKIDAVKAKIKSMGGDLDGSLGGGLATKAQASAAAVEGIGGKTSFLSGIIGKLGPLMGVAFGFTALVTFGQKVLEVTARFQTYQAVLTNTFGSAKIATDALALLQETAAQTPFSLDQLTDSYVKFANRGVKLTKEELVALGDVASSTGKSFDQLTEAALDAFSGENERLKEFGITAAKTGSTTQFTFKGVTTEVANTTGAIREYLTGLGKIEGVSGSMAAISGTLEGKISNLGDSFDALLNKIGKSSNFIFTGLIDGAKAAIDAIASIVGKNESAIQQLTDEQTRVQGLLIEITSLNVGTAKRTQLIQQLQKEYPAFLSNLDAEKVSNEELTKAIDDVSASLANRIVIQRKQDEIAEQAEKTADAIQAREAARAKIQKELVGIYAEQERARAGGQKAMRLDVETGVVSAGRGIDIRALNTNLKDYGEKAEATLNAVFKKSIEVNRGFPGVARLQSAYTEYNKANAEFLKQQTAEKGLMGERRELVEALMGSEEELIRQSGSGLETVKKLTAAQVNQIQQYRKYVDEARGLDTALTAAELDKLNKALLAVQKKADKERADALKDLQKELADLEKEYQKAQLESLEKGGLEYLQEVRRQANAQVDATVKAIQDKEKAYAKAGGNGALADGQLGPEQQKAVQQLRANIDAEYFEGVRKLQDERIDELLALTKDGEEKEVALIERKYEKLIRAAEKAKDDTLRIALEQNRDLELASLNRTTGMKQIGQEETIRTLAVENSPVAPVGTDFDPIAAEREKQKAILEIQIEANYARLLLLQDATSNEDLILQGSLKKTLKGLYAQVDALNAQAPGGKGFDLLSFLGVKEGDRAEVEKAFQLVATQVVQQVGNLAEANVQATTKQAEARKEDLDEKRDELALEIELNKLGFASNIEGKRAEVEEAKKLRQQALEDQRKAQREQILLETATQSIGLISSAVDIIKGFSKIPVIGLPLGIAAVTAMYGFFFASKAKALQATKFEKGGDVRTAAGQRHSSGGNKYISMDGNDASVIEIEAGEKIISRKAVSQHGELLDAMNAGDEARMVEYLVESLLNGTGIAMPAADLPQRLTATHTAREEARQTVTVAALAGSDIAEDIAGIRANTKPGMIRSETDTATVYTDGAWTRIVRK